MFDQERTMNEALRATAYLPCPRLMQLHGSFHAPHPLASDPGERANGYIKGLAPWLRAAPRSTQEIAAAIFRFIPFAAEEPRELDFLYKLPKAMKENGITAHGIYQDDLTWRWRSRIGCESSVHVRQAPGFMEVLDQPARFENVFTAGRPPEIRKVIELLVMLNARWLRENNRETSAIVRGFFPAACQEACDSWLMSLVEDALWDVGYTPIGEGGEPSDVAFQDLVWFCDGDVRDALSYSRLWSKLVGGRSLGGQRLSAPPGARFTPIQQRTLVSSEEWGDELPLPDKSKRCGRQ